MLIAGGNSFPRDWLGVPPLRGVSLFLASPRKSKQKEGDPGSVPAAPVPCATRDWRGLRNSGFALRQSSPFIRQPLRCSAPLKGPGETIHAWAWCLNDRFHFWPFFPVDRGNRLFALHPWSPNAFGAPVEGAEQRRKAGGSRRGLFEGRSPEFRSRPAFRVAQGTGNAGAAPGVAFSLATFFWRSKRKYARQQGGNPS